jgi:putative hemolysin
VTSSAFSFLLVAVLIGLNGFFASAEVALLSVRPSRLRQMADDGVKGAHAALSLIANPGRLLSVTQVGVTLTSLGLGWAGEEPLFQFLLSVFHPLVTPATLPYFHWFSFGFSFLIISYCHVVLGEVVPKNLAIDRAARLAVVVAPALLVFNRVSAPFVRIIESSGSRITRALGLRGEHQSGGHSAEELKLIVSSSRGLGYLPEEQEDMIHRVLDLGAISVREIMVPRQNIVSIPITSPLEEVLGTMIQHVHSRLPVWEDSPERIVGVLHYKDLLPVWEERRRANRAGRPAQPFRLRRLIRKHYVVPETKPVLQLLEDFRDGSSHMAMVVDEFGTIVGMLTVEDVLEQIVGKIDDEHDEKSARPALAPDVFELDGATRIRDLETEFGIEIPADAGFETLAGFLLHRIGAIPRAGEAAEAEGRRFTVLEMDRNRIARVRIEKL